MNVYRRLVTTGLLLFAGVFAGCSNEVKIGAVVSRTGGTAPYGQMVAKGLDLALEQINAAGGVLGGPVQLIYRDDESRPEKGVEAVNDLIDNENTRLIIGAVSSTVTLAIAEVCQKRGVLLLSPSASAPKLSLVGDYIFRNYPSDIIEGTAMAEFAKDHGVRRVVIFAMQNDFGHGLLEVFRRQFESKSRKILETFEFNADATPEELAPIVAKAKELEPQGVYVIAYVNEMAALLQEMKAAGMNALMMGSGAVTEDLPRLAGDAAEHLVYAQPKLDIKSTDPAVASFVKAFTDKYKQPPDIFAAHAYDALNLLVEAVRKAGMAHPDAVKLQMLNLEYDGAAGHSAFDERGDVTRYPQLFVLSGGVAVPYDRFEEEGGKLPIPGT